jgi:hypothetical protein
LRLARWCSAGGLDLRQTQEFGGFDDADALVASQSKHVLIATDDVLCSSDDSTLQNNIVIGIGGDDFQRSRNLDDFGEGANLGNGFVRFISSQTTLELKLLVEFSENGFAS